MNRNTEEIHLGRYLSRRLRPLTMGIGLLICLFFPVTYYLIEYKNMNHTAEFHAARFARAMHGLVLQSEEIWKYQIHEYKQIIDVLPLEREINLQVFDSAGKPIKEYEHINPGGTDWLDDWAPSASAPINFNNRVIGTVKVSMSQGVLLARTFLIFIISLFVGTVLAALAYFFPVGIVTRMGKRIENLIMNLQDAEAESRRLQLEAQQSEKRFRELVHGLDAIVWEADATNWRFSFVSRQAGEILGYPVDLWLNEPGFWQERLEPEEREEIIDRYRSGFRAGSSFQVEHRFGAADGRKVWIRNLIRVMPRDSSDGNRIRGVIVDITQQKLAEETLASEKERLAVTLRSIGDGVITTDTDGRVLLLNSVAEHLTGWNQAHAAGRQLHEVFKIIDERTGERKENPVDMVVKSGSIVQLADNTILVGRDGTERIIENSAAPICSSQSKIIGVVLAFRDMTEKKQMTRDLMKSQQLESLGVLAGGIAHDFNNLLTGILGNISLAKIYLEPESKAFMKLQEAENIYERARDLTQRLLTFSKGGAPKKKTLFIDRLIADAANFTLSGSNVRCHFSISEGLWPVDADEGQISQVVNNLVINADQAMPDGGVINISLENLTVAPGVSPPLMPGRYVKITVADQGIGIPEGDLPKIFDPYFTTKQRGNGLGLATVHSIVRHHEGHISVESRLGTGTTFDIYLHASENEPVQCSKSRGRMIQGNEKVLVMDDEEIIRDVACEILCHLGYRVADCCDGNEAIDLYRQAGEAGEPFDVVIIDLTIPGGMGGMQAMKSLLEIDPEVKAIVSSGYSNDPIIANYQEYGFRGFVVKPYKIEELGDILHKVLHSPDERISRSIHQDGISI